MWYQQQRNTIIIEFNRSCDLLENIYLCGINNNQAFASVLHATRCDLLENIYLCGINNNLHFKPCDFSLGCDLLENIYLCGINNNRLL